MLSTPLPHTRFTLVFVTDTYLSTFSTTEKILVYLKAGILQAGHEEEAMIKLFEYCHRSFAAEVIADNSGKWAGNGLRFATRQQAEGYARDLEWRWTLVRAWRVVPSTDDVNRGTI